MIAKLTYNADGTGRLEVAGDDGQLVDISRAVLADTIQLVRPLRGGRPGLRFQVATKLLEITGVEAIASTVWCGAWATGPHDTEQCALPPGHEPQGQHVSLLGHIWTDGADQ